MDRKTLKQYKALRREIVMLDNSIESLRRKLEKVPAVAGKVQMSMADFPYTRTSLTVEMLEPKEQESINRVLRIKEQRRRRAFILLEEIEMFIGGIPDSMDRQIFEEVYINGKTYREVGDELGYYFTAIQKRIDNVLELQQGTKCTK